MKKTLMLAFAALATSIGASAGTLTVNCPLFPTLFGGGSTGSPATANCPGLTPAQQASFGAVGLNSVTLNYYSDYTFGSTPAQVTEVFTPSTFSTVTWSASSTTIVVNGNLSSSSTTPPVPVSVTAASGVSLANFGAAFNVGITSAVTAGTVGTSSAGVTVTYNYKDATPEPATLSLIGLSLAGLGIAVRRRRA